MPIVDLGTLKVEIKVLKGNSDEEFDGLGKKSKKTADEVAAHWRQVSSSLISAGTSLTRYVTLPIIAAGAAAVKFSSDMTETVNKVNEVFGGNAKVVERWADNSLRKMGLAKESAMDYAAAFGDLGSSMGQSSTENLKYSTTLVQLSADMASFKNISAERARTALTGIYTGETEALKGLGIVMTEANLEAYALSHGYDKQYKDLSRLELLNLRYNFVMDAAKNSMGDFARTSSGTANQTRMLGENVKETGAIFGEIVEPTVNKVIVATNELLDNVKQLNPETKETIVVSGMVVAAVGPVLLLIGKGIKAYNDLTKVVAAANIKMQLSAGAIGAVSLAIGLLIGVAASVVGSYNRITEAASKLADANKKAADDVSAAKEALDDNLIATDANVKMALTYTSRLAELSAAQSLDNAQRAESRYLVDQLNQMYPELNAQIDEQTGKIVGGTQAINDQIAAIQARAVATAYEEQYTAVLQAQNDLLYAAAAAETERAMITEENNEIIAERTALEEEFLAKTGLSLQAIGELDQQTQSAMLSGDRALQGMVDRHRSLGYQVDQNKIAISALDRELERNRTATSAAEKEVAIATETYKRLTGSSDALGQSLKGTAGDIAATGDAAAEAEPKLKDYTDETINNLERLPRAVRMSAEKATANLIENNATMTQWMSDLATLVERGMDEGVVAKLYDMGPKFRSVVSDLAKGTPDAMIAFQDAMLASGDMTGAKFTTGVKKSVESVTKPLADASSDVDKWTSKTTSTIATMVDVGVIAKLRTISPAWVGVIAQLIQINNTNLSAFKQSMLTSGAESGNNFYVGLSNTMLAKMSSYYQLGYQAGRKFVAGYNDAQRSKSPSREAIQSAINWGDGIEIGTIQSTNKLVSAAQAQARIPINATKAALGSLPKIMGGSLPASHPVYNNTTTNTTTSVVTRGKVEQHIHYASQPQTAYQRQVEQRRASRDLAKELA